MFHFFTAKPGLSEIGPLEPYHPAQGIPRGAGNLWWGLLLKSRVQSLTGDFLASNSCINPCGSLMLLTPLPNVHLDLAWDVMGERR